MLRLIARVVEHGAARCGREVSLCGDMAGDPRHLPPLLLGAGCAPLGGARALGRPRQARDRRGDLRLSPMRRPAGADARQGGGRALQDDPASASSTTVRPARASASPIALGKNRSFVSQITNPAYAMPIPAQHLEIIFEICHFSPRRAARLPRRLCRGASAAASRGRRARTARLACPHGLSCPTSATRREITSSTA